MEFKVSDHCAGQLEDHNTKTIKKNVVRNFFFNSSEQKIQLIATKIYVALVTNLINKKDSQKRSL
jgi:hypothetical protein